jgi:hypothetical protein
MNFSKFALWSAVASLTALAAGVAQYFGFWQFLWAEDPSRLSYTIFAIFTLATIYVGWLTWKFDHGTAPSAKVVDNLWFTSNVLVDLGMLGTVIGFLITFTGVFADIDITQTETANKILSHIGTGMSTALLTTLAGMSTAIVLKLQLLVLGEFDEA